MQLILASHNRHKIRELKALLKEFAQLDVLSLLDFPHYSPPEEVGASFVEIATRKAVHAAETLGKWTLADDSGLVVPALQGAPGVYSARYAGEGATDLENRKKLLKEMQDILERQAFFECALALCSPEGQVKCAHGSIEGTLLDKERGRNGFGYDPLFVKHEYSKTMAELEESLKNRISHRRKALDKLAIHLNALSH